GGRKYILTNRRLILKRGIVKRQSTDLILRRCEGVSIAQSIMGRVLGYGTVTVSTGEVANEFNLIEHPVEFATNINQQIADAQGKAPFDIA
ncbi:MAG: PH domain-containing protein, partial [Prevotella sp.]|nr:PH domain-containing protein [Prevotella sp.]